MRILYLLSIIAVSACGQGPVVGHDDRMQLTSVSPGPDANTKLWGISGQVTNANPNAWVALRNGNDVLTVYGSNVFMFTTQYVNNTAYRVLVGGSDPNIACTISNDVGFIANAHVTNVAVACAAALAPLFSSGFEAADRPPDWSNTADNSAGAGGLANVVGYCCGMPSAQSMLTTMEGAHTGTASLVFSGAAQAGATNWAYMKVFNLTALSLSPGAYLYYWIFPQTTASTLGAGVQGPLSAYSGVDLTFSDATAMRFRPGFYDQYGNVMAPSAQGGLVPDSWNFVAVGISSVFPRTLVNLSIGWERSGTVGGYRGYLDDVGIDYSVPVSHTYVTSWEAFENQPTWVDTADHMPGGGGADHVSGICCGIGTIEAHVTSEFARTGTHALVYAGRGNGVAPNYAYTQVLDLSHSNVTLGGISTLSYWIYPQSQDAFSAVADDLSNRVAVDLIFSDGSALRGSGLLDGRRAALTPAGQGGVLQLDQWNHVTVALGTLAGKVPVRLDVGWSHPGTSGGYRGFIDDISIADVKP